jgi:hypothetical protein
MSINFINQYQSVISDRRQHAGGKQICLLGGFAEATSSTLQMEAMCSSETSVGTQRTKRRHMPEDDTLHNHRCEHLKSYKVITLLTVIFVMSAHTLFRKKGIIILYTLREKSKNL